MSYHFFIGKEDVLIEKSVDNPLEFIKKKMSDVLEIKNLSFLLGAGCSSLKKKEGETEEEQGVPVMSQLAKEIHEYMKIDSEEDEDIFSEDEASEEVEEGEESKEEAMKIFFLELVNVYNKKNSDGEITNLEHFLGYLFKKNSVLQSEGGKTESMDLLIKELKSIICNRCHESVESPVKDVYENFYKKILLRSENLPRVNIFTTNYDLFSERALDELRCTYNNGFSGFINRIFTPSIFNYNQYQEMEIKSSELLPIANSVFLYKLHGSINWVEDKGEIKELQNPSNEGAMIYPTPQKGELTFGSPYSELFREFQKKLMFNENILVCVGYSFSDDHINNIIYQSLTLPKFKLIIFAGEQNNEIDRLKALNDSRIWIIGSEGEEERLHYFKNMVDTVLPSLEEQKIQKTIDDMKKANLERKILESKVSDLSKETVPTLNM